MELFSGSYGLILDEIDEDELARRMLKVTKADGLCLTRWLQDSPEDRINTSLGESITLPPCFADWVNAHLPEGIVSLPLLLDSLSSTASSAARHAESQAFVHDPHHVCVLLDTEPSRLLYILTRNPANPPWSDEEREIILTINEVSRRSVRVHKQLDRLKKIVDTANAIFNSSPRGMIGLLPDGSIRIANGMATQILQEEDTLNVVNNRVRISDKELQKELDSIIDGMHRLTQPEADRVLWHRAIRRSEGEQPLQLSLRVLTLADWRIESLPSDKMAILFINDPARLQEPTKQELKDYYGLTAAQSSVVIALWGGRGITEAAEKLSISVNTARTHLRAIYDKVGVKSHAELMAVLTTMVTRHGDSGGPQDFLLPSIQDSYRE